MTDSFAPEQISEPPPDQQQLEKAMSDILEGRATLQEAKGLSDQQLEAIYSVAYNHYQADQFPEAIAVFSWLCLLNPHQSRFWAGLGSSSQMNGDYENAINAYGYASLTGDAHEPSHYLQIAECCLGLGRKDEALEALADAERLSAQSTEHRSVAERATGLIALLQEQRQ